MLFFKSSVCAEQDSSQTLKKNFYEEVKRHGRLGDSVTQDCLRFKCTIKFRQKSPSLDPEWVPGYRSLHIS
jgi:hypothetical protein